MEKYSSEIAKCYFYITYYNKGESEYETIL